MGSRHFKTGWCWIIGGGLTLAFAGWTQAAEPQVQEKKAVKKEEPAKDPLFPFTISKETTYFTEPLKPDGTVDYAAALNARNSEGLTPENNAGVLLMRAFGVGSVPEANRKAFFKSLGIAVPEGNESTLQNFDQIVKPHLKAKGIEGENQEAYQPFWDQQGQAMSRPWSRKEFPLVADWVDANETALNLAIEATQKKRLYFPMIVEDGEPLLNFTLEPVQNMRAIARLLTARAMLALEEGRFEEAQADLLACHRLASLLGHQATMIEVLVSCAIDAIACQADLALVQSEKVTPEQLAAYRQKLADLPALPTLSESIDQGERFFGLDSIANLATQKMDGEGLGLPNAKLWKRMLGLSIDWDSILKRFNKQYDEMAAALKLPSYAERMGGLAKMEDELEKAQKEANQPAQFALMFLGVDPPRAVVSRQLGNVLLGLLMPAVSMVSQAETRAEIRRELTIIALALAEYQREQGQYPETLNALSPKYLKTLPQDRFTGKPLKYQPQDKGYLLYSVGPNGKDDKGKRDGIETDDVTIRVPSEPEL